MTPQREILGTFAISFVHYDVKLVWGLIEDGQYQVRFTSGDRHIEVVLALDTHIHGRAVDHETA